MGLLLTVVGFEQFDQGHLDAKVLGILNSPFAMSVALISGKQT